MYKYDHLITPIHTTIVYDMRAPEYDMRAKVLRSWVTPLWMCE